MIRALFFVWLLITAISTSTFAQQSPKVERSVRVVFVDGASYALHTVARKQTLFSIAQAYGLPVSAITRANPYLGDRLEVNSTLLVPLGTTTTSTTAPAAPERKEAFIATPTNQPVVGERVRIPVEPIISDTVVTTNLPIDVGTIRTNPTRGIEMALLLPFGGKSNEGNFVEFLCGSLLAVDALKEEGITVRLNVHSTEATTEKVHSLIGSGALDRADVLIGPVYDAPFEVVGSWATQRRTPIISPLGSSGSLDNPYVVCAAPSEATKHDALRTALANPLAKVIYIDCGADNDEEWAQVAIQNLPIGTDTLLYLGKETKVNELSDLLSRKVQNLIVLPTSNETVAEAILSRLSSINAAGRYNISVLGTPRWARFGTMNLDLFFKLGVSYTTSYHADRNEQRVADFFHRYIDTFGSIPSPYAMRGYDVTTWVAQAMSKSGERFLMELPQFSPTILQTPYQFGQPGGVGTKFENVRWAWVTYRPNYAIEVQ